LIISRLKEMRPAGMKLRFVGHTINSAVLDISIARVIVHIDWAPEKEILLIKISVPKLRGTL